MPFDLSHCLTVEVQHLVNLLAGCMLVDSDVSHFAQKGEVDGARSVLLVMSHELVETVVLLAIEGENAVCFADELYGLTHFLLGESRLDA